MTIEHHKVRDRDSADQLEEQDASAAGNKANRGDEERKPTRERFLEYEDIVREKTSERYQAENTSAEEAISHRKRACMSWEATLRSFVLKR